MDMEQKYLKPQTRTSNEVAEVLRRARMRIEKPERWMKGGDGGPHGPNCILGAVFEVDKNYPREVTKCLRAACGDDIVSFNNAPSRTHAEVLAAFDRAIALAEQQQP